MTVSGKAFYIMRPQPLDGTVVEEAPIIVWGEGTPDGDAEPWKSAKKGSIWLQTDASDDTTPFHVKVDEGNDDADWDKIPLVVLSMASVINATSLAGSAAYFH